MTTTAPATLDTATLSRRLLAHFRSPSYRPPLLPVIAVEIMSLSQQPEVSREDILAVLERDPLLAAQVLKLARSAQFGARQEAATLRDAVVRLGIEALRDLVFEVSLNTRVFQAQGYTEAMERLRVHSVATGMATRVVCKHTNTPGSLAFLGGLLHDVGVAGLLVACSEMPERPTLPEVWPVVLQMHAEASGALARLWGLPERLRALLTFHHHGAIEGEPDPLLFSLIVGERLAFELAPLVGDDPSTTDRPRVLPGKDISAPGLVQHAARALGISGPLWTEIHSEVRSLMTTLR